MPLRELRVLLRSLNLNRRVAKVEVVAVVVDDAIQAAAEAAVNEIAAVAVAVDSWF